MAKDKEKQFLGTDNQTTNPVSQALSGVQNPQENTNAKTDYYENLKNESYKAMLSKEVQASVAQDQARKYTQYALNSAGLGTQGIAESTSLGIGNKYTQALADAQSQYTTDLANINQQQRAEELTTSNNNFQEISALMGGAMSMEELDKIYNAYAQDKTLDDKSKKQLEALYGIYSSRLSEDETVDTAWFDKMQRIGDISTKPTTFDLSILSKKVDSKVVNELKDFLYNAKDGDVIGTTKGQKTEYYVYYGGQIYSISAEGIKRAGKTVKQTIKVA